MAEQKNYLARKKVNVLAKNTRENALLDGLRSDPINRMRGYVASSMSHAPYRNPINAPEISLGDVARQAIAFAPGIGDLQSGAEALDYAQQGRPVMAGMAGLGALPFVPSFAGTLAGKASKIDIPNIPKHNIDELFQQPKAVDYGIQHRPPMRDGGAPLHDLTGGGNVYPDDVYSRNAITYYGTGDPSLDRDTFRIINSYKDNPDAPVTIYRAVPKDIPADAKINPGDWVTINPKYAKAHGESALEGNYRIIKQQVKAKDIYTNGDSIHEFGYDPDM